MQPVSVSLDAGERVFRSYKSGIFDSSDCGTFLNHAVLAVGYGTDATTGKDYWLVKNSWNTGWGEKGYIRLAIEEGEGICGVQMYPSYPTTN